MKTSHSHNPTMDHARDPSISLSHVFLTILILHALTIVGALAYHWLSDSEEWHRFRRGMGVAIGRLALKVAPDLGVSRADGELFGLAIALRVMAIDVRLSQIEKQLGRPEPHQGSIPPAVPRRSPQDKPSAANRDSRVIRIGHPGAFRDAASRTPLT